MEAIEINARALQIMNERIDSLPHEKLLDCFYHPEKNRGATRDDTGGELRAHGAWPGGGRSSMELYDRIEKYLTGRLYPFWFERVAAPEGGFTTYFDRHGKPTGQTDKTLIQQTRSIFMLVPRDQERVRRGAGARPARDGLDWFLRTFRDPEHDGWYWIVDRDGKPVGTDKIMYGQSFVIYAMSECALATGDAAGARGGRAHLRAGAEVRGRHALRRLPRDVPARLAAAAGGAYGGDRKSFDVHMHLMEAYTTLYELTGRRSTAGSCSR